MNLGRVTQILGAVIDVSFPQGDLPSIFTALKTTNPSIDEKEYNRFHRDRLQLEANQVSEEDFEQLARQIEDKGKRKSGVGPS